MCTFVHCDIDSCAYNRDRECGKESISIEWKATRDFCCGKRVYYPICKDCKEIGDDGAD